MVKHLLTFFILLFPVACLSQEGLISKCHSHNDYKQDLPFYDAYARHFGSIEADVWAYNGKLWVGHDKEDISKGLTFESLYLLPIVERFKYNKGQIYKNGDPLQLLIDLKSSYKETLPLLKDLLAPFYNLFDLKNNPHAVRIVISGEMPPADSLHLFDPVFTFDGRIGTTYPQKDLERVRLVSDNVQKFINWDGDRKLSPEEFLKLKGMVDSIHQEGKLIRFWATPNSVRAYKELIRLDVDYIGTDRLGLTDCFLRGKEDKY